MPVQSELLQATIVRGEPVNLQELTKLSGAIARLLLSLGLKKRDAA
jgi:hypothetical protein